MSLRLYSESYCPFCKTELLIKDKSKRKSPFFSFWMIERERKCRKCGAKRMEVCPSCKETYYGVWKNKEGVYKHEFCGFTGKKIVRKKGNKNAGSTKKKELHKEGRKKGKKALSGKLRKAEGER